MNSKLGRTLLDLRVCFVEQQSDREQASVINSAGVNVFLRFWIRYRPDRSMLECLLVNNRDSYGKVAHEYRVPLS